MTIPAFRRYRVTYFFLKYPKSNPMTKEISVKDGADALAELNRVTGMKCKIISKEEVTA